MAVPPVLRAEYFDAALEKTSDEVELELLREMRIVAVAIAEQDIWVTEQCIANRLAAGEDPKRLGAPRSVQSASERAAADIHKMQLRKCRRATRPQEIIESLLQLSTNDIEFWRPLLGKFDLQANRELSEQLLAQKQVLQEKLKLFLARSSSAA
jgi:hypothetical protein